MTSPETAESVIESRALDYLALMSCDAADGWLHTAEKELESWLSRKRWDVDARRDGEFHSGTRSLQILHHSDGKARSLRARLVERDTPQGTWTTEMLAQDKLGDGDWIRIHVENDLGNFVDVPNLAKGLMQALPLSDSSLQFVDQPQVFSEGRIDDLLDILCDEDRNGLVFVAGTDTQAQIPFDPFVRKVHDWTRQVFGLAQVVVLDPMATAALSEALDGHATPPWTIRTYYPGVDPASVVDGRRHKILSTERLANASEGYVRKLLGRVARVHAARAPAPAHVVKTRRTFQRLENKLVFEASPSALGVEAPEPRAAIVPPAVASPASAQAPAAPASMPERHEAVVDDVTAALRERLGIDEVNLTTIDLLAARLREVGSLRDSLILAQAKLERAEAQVEGLQARAEVAEDAFRRAESLLDDGQEDRAVLQDQLESLAAQCRWLQSELADRGDYETAYGATPETFTPDYPSSFELLMDRREDLAKVGIVFTCDDAKAMSLDEHDTLQSAVRTTWDALLALRDYIRARAEGVCDKSVDHYLKHTPAGYATFPPGKHAATETGTTMNRWKEERRFAVPASVDPSESVTMTAHFKLAQIGMVSPRMYYLDQVPVDGNIYIGYIGPHLTNTQS